MPLNPRSTRSIRFEEFRKHLKPLRSALPFDLADVLTQDAVAELLRVRPNCFAHPTCAATSRAKRQDGLDR